MVWNKYYDVSCFLNKMQNHRYYFNINTEDVLKTLCFFLFLKHYLKNCYNYTLKPIL